MQSLSIKNAQETYQKQRILTASPLELIVMLYDGLHKNIVLAQRAIARQDTQSSHAKLIKAQDIIEELMSCLDLTIPMSDELLKIYEFVLFSLQQANVKKDVQLLQDVLEVTDNLREAWNELNKSGEFNQQVQSVEHLSQQQGAAV